MPIDFNPSHHFSVNLSPRIVNQRQYNYFQEQEPDMFVKSASSASAYDGIQISKKSFGKLQKTNQKVSLYTIKNKNGASVDLSDFGATIISIKVPDKDGQLRDVIQGYNDVTPYETAPVGHAGGTIGPCANKISGGQFILNGELFDLEKNKDNGRTHCHGGSEGLDVKLWSTKVLPDGIEFTYRKKDMENGYPGNVDNKVTYKLDNDNNLRIMYEAKTDKDTVLNMTNHTYFNLDGAENAHENSVYEHIVELPNSSTYTKNNEMSIPTGEIASVEGTPMDFREEKTIGDVINSDFDQLKIGSGFDQNYCIDDYDGKTVIEAANIKSKKTGIALKVLTNLPGFQFYTANHLGKTTQPAGKDGERYEKRSALCIEPQFFPNAINTPSFEKPILKPGEKYQREIIYAFSAS